MSSKAGETPLYLSRRGGGVLTLWLEDKIVGPDYEQGAQDTPGNELPGLILGAMSVYIILGLCAIDFQNLKVGLKSLLEIQEEEKKRNMTFRKRKSALHLFLSSHFSRARPFRIWPHPSNNLIFLHRPPGFCSRRSRVHCPSRVRWTLTRYLILCLVYKTEDSAGSSSLS